MTTEMAKKPSLQNVCSRNTFKAWVIGSLFVLFAFFLVVDQPAFGAPFQEGGAPAASGQEQGGGGDAADANKKPGFFDNWFLFVLPVIFLLFMFMTGRPNQKEKKKREEFIGSLKKNDEIVTAGGIVAKVVAVKNNPNTVKLLLDEKTGATMTVTHAAVSRIFKNEDEETTEEKKD